MSLSCPGRLPRPRRTACRSPLFPLGAGLRREEPKACQGLERVLSGGTVHSGRGISGLLTGALPPLELRAAAAWPSEPSTEARGAPGMLWGSGFLARRALRSGTHLGAEDKQIRVRLSSRPYTPMHLGYFLRARVTPTASPAGILGIDECPARPAPEINLPLDGTDAAGHHCAHFSGA